MAEPLTPNTNLQFKSINNQPPGASNIPAVVSSQSPLGVRPDPKAKPVQNQPQEPVPKQQAKPQIKILTPPKKPQVIIKKVVISSTKIPFYIDEETGKKYSYANINDYIRYINEHFIKTGTLSSGQIYVYRYLFNKDPNFNKKPFNEIKFYDFMPASYIFNINMKTKTFFGLNFHHLPLYDRRVWLARVSNFQNKMTGQLNIKLKYQALKALMRKSILGVRQYRFDRVLDLRLIPYEQWINLFNFYAKTYYAVTIDQVESKYRQLPTPTI
ncbi:MAG: hypothetical protein QXG00_06635 [Candidatus Woesearchaeota archaeon]